MNRAFLVFGPESSATRLITGALIALGCTGDDGHVQRFDGDDVNSRAGDANAIDLVALRNAPPPVVFRRSFPHGVRSGSDAQRWLRVAEVIGRFRDCGLEPHVVVTVRESECVVRSQVRRFPVTREVAMANIERAYREIFAGILAAGVGFTVVPYESLVAGGSDAIRRLGAQLGLHAESVPALEVFDANAKYAAAG